MVVASATIIKDTILFIRNRLKSNITDPLSRTSGVGFVITSYSKRPTKYPIISVKLDNLEFVKRLGMNQEKYQVSLTLQIRVWARNEIERDDLTQQTISFLNSNQFPYTTSNTSSNEELHDLKILNTVDVDEIAGVNGCEQTLLSRIIRVHYTYLYGFS